MKDVLIEHIPRVYRFAIRLAGDSHVAEEIVQETCLRAWRHRNELRTAGALRTWLFRIAVNVWRDQVRRWGLQAGAATNYVPRPPAPSADRVAVDRDEVCLAMRWMDELPARQRQVLYLHAIEDLTHGEIGKVLDLSDEAVKANLSLARKRMRDKLAESQQSQRWGT